MKVAAVGQVVEQTNEPTWKLRLVSIDTASIVVARDTEKEDRHKAIKETWETSQPGRAAKAREARDSYLKQCDAGSIAPITYNIPGATRNSILKPVNKSR